MQNAPTTKLPTSHSADRRGSDTVHKVPVPDAPCHNHLTPPRSVPMVATGEPLLGWPLSHDPRRCTTPVDVFASTCRHSPNRFCGLKAPEHAVISIRCKCSQKQNIGHDGFPDLAVPTKLTNTSSRLTLVAYSMKIPAIGSHTGSFAHFFRGLT